MSFQDEHLPEYTMPGDFSPEERLQIQIDNFVAMMGNYGPEASKYLDFPELKIESLSGFFKDLT